MKHFPELEPEQAPNYSPVLFFHPLDQSHLIHFISTFSALLYLSSLFLTFPPPSPALQRNMPAAK